MKDGSRSLSNKVLVVEDSRSVSGFLCRQIEKTLHFDPVPAYSLKETRDILENEQRFFVAVLDLNLPDAPNGEIVSYVLARKIPSIVLTAYFDEGIRERILAKNVVDYVLKDSPRSLDHVKGLIQRIHRNRNISILLVDDSQSFRSYSRKLLEAQRFQVLEAQNGEEGLRVLETNPGVRLVITDYNMPVMDGFELVSKVRELYSKNEVGVIGLSAQGSGVVSAKFLKVGANDFLAKPFSTEEFYARVTQNIELMEFIEELREAAIRDPMTKLYNRRYFFEAGSRLLEEARETGTPVSIAMIDIDRFKGINDRFGHEAGDAVIVRVADILRQAFVRTHVISRFGGEEFCILARGLSGERAGRFLEDFRRLVENSEVRYSGQSIRFTVSVGLASGVDRSLEAMIRGADRMLYSAKRGGRNKVVSETPGAA